ncbi:DUF4040 domain-containing protein [Archangium violaceum]|nr:DUF4040 domain-containing protein [Archangium violaceum]
MLMTLPLLLAVLCVPLALVAGAWRPAAAAWVGVTGAAAALAALFWGAAQGPASISVPWAPTWGVNLELSRDGLSVLYGALALGVGGLVALYSRAYIPHHLEEQHRPEREEVRFLVLMLSFMASMVLLVMARDILLLFVALDLTTLTSYLLIGFDRREARAREAALTALVVTGTTSVFFLVGVLLLANAHGSFSLPEVLARAEPGPVTTVAMACLAVAALGKSAQVPFHFWLPRAMAAPTPVSAYLHSAAMVAAGVFLLQRLHPLLEKAPEVRAVLLGVGLASMAAGSLLALTRDVLKEVLAYSTIAQYGYVVVMVALGAEGAPLYVLAHGLCKAALFLTAGAVIQLTGRERLSELGGLGRALPGLAVGSALAAAGLAGLPLTLGFFKDEVFFHALSKQGPALKVAGTLGAGLTLAYSGRFWWDLFAGTKRPGPVHRASRLLTLPVGVLAAAVLLGGVWPAPFEHVARAAGAEMVGHPVELSLAYHLDARTENLLALAAWALGGLLLATRRTWEAPLGRAMEVAGRWGPARGYAGALAGVDWLSSALHRLEVRDLRDRVAAVLVPAGLLGLLALWAHPVSGRFAFGPVGWGDVPLLLVLAFAAGAALATLRARGHLSLVLLLSCVGFSLALAFTFAAAPDVALTALLVETTFTLLFAALLRLLPRERLERAQAEALRPRRRDLLSALVAGGSAALLSWNALSHTREERLGEVELRAAEAAHAEDAVTAVLSDMRGLDTVGEVSVVVVALLGLTRLLRKD